MVVVALLSLLESHSFRRGRSDVIFWSPNPLDGFSYKSFHTLVDPSPLQVSVFIVLWRIKIPRMVRFFTWQVLDGRANTLNRLVRKLPSLVEPFCWKAEEDLDHILCAMNMQVVFGILFSQRSG